MLASCRVIDLENEPTWSNSEKTIARTAFDAALGRELHDVIQEVKRTASEIQESSDLWDLEHYLTERRKQIDGKYDYRYSQRTSIRSLAKFFVGERSLTYMLSTCDRVLLGLQESAFKLLSTQEYHCVAKGSDMCFRLAATLLVLTASFTFAQNGKQRLCDAPSATTVKHDGGVIVEKVMLSGKWGSNGATVYLPDKEIADGAIVFSHSAINTNNGSPVDLLPLALTLAHAGAAVIVPARSLAWPPTDHSSNREGAVVICAEHWLIDHTKVFNNGEPTVNDKNIVVREGYAYLGPRVCDPTVLDQCDFMGPFVSEDCALKHYCRQSVWVPVGETEGGDNTRSIISDQGSKTASWLQKKLGLAPIRAVAVAESF